MLDAGFFYGSRGSGLTLPVFFFHKTAQSAPGKRMQESRNAQERKLVVNGQEMTVQAGTLSDLLLHLALPDSAVVAEVNGTIVARENFAAFVLRNGDTIELVRFVGGG